MPAAVAGAALMVAAGGAVAVVAPPLGTTAAVTLSETGSLVAALLLLVGAALVAAGSVAWFGRRDHLLSVVAFAAAAAWMGMELAGRASVTSEARSAGLLITPLLAPLAIHLPLRATHADAASPPLRWLLVALYAVVGLAAIGRSLTYDPFFDLFCTPVCSRGDNVLAVVVDMPLARSFTSIATWATVFGGVSLVVWSVQRLLRDGRARCRRERLVLLPAALLGGAMAWWAAAGSAMPPYGPDDVRLLLPAVATAVGLGAVGIDISVSIIGEQRRADSLRRMADEITAGSQGLRTTLARTLDDPRLQVVYPVSEGGFIDDQGDPVEEPRSSARRAVTTIERAGVAIAYVDHAAELDPDVLDREIGAAARLAVDNERLEATIRARLRALQASRARIVATSDSTRVRLERDLHDGAQQRLLAVSFELRLASVAMAKSGHRDSQSAALAAMLADALGEMDLALSELRTLAHGIHPVVLVEDGLVGALASMADVSAIPVVVVAARVDRCAERTELAAYAAVVEALRQAEEAGAGRLDVNLTERAERLAVSMAARGLEDGPRWVKVGDRVGAAGGSLSWTESAGPGTLSVDLPCA